MSETETETTTDQTTTSTSETEGDTLLTKETPESTSEGGTLLTKGEEPPEPAEPLTPDDITLPEGFEVDEAAQASFLEVANKHAFTKEMADDLVALQADMAKAASDSISEAWNTMQDEWKAAAEASPEFGGAKLPAALGSIKEMINEVAGEEAKDLLEALDVTGAGSHPALIGFLYKLAQERGEGTMTVGSPVSPTTSLADKMFPDQGKK